MLIDYVREKAGMRVVGIVGCHPAGYRPIVNTDDIQRIAEIPEKLFRKMEKENMAAPPIKPTNMNTAWLKKEPSSKKLRQTQRNRKDKVDHPHFMALWLDKEPTLKDVQGLLKSYAKHNKVHSPQFERIGMPGSQSTYIFILFEGRSVPPLKAFTVELYGQAERLTLKDNETGVKKPKGRLSMKLDEKMRNCFFDLGNTPDAIRYCVSIIEADVDYDPAQMQDRTIGE